LISHRAVVDVLACLLLPGCAAGSGTVGTTIDGSTPTERPTVSTPASTVDVTCQAATTEVVGASATVASDGLHVMVADRSGRSGTYLNYSSPTPDGGAPGSGVAVAPGTSLLVLAVPPGPVDLNCSYDTGTTQTPKVRITATDPNHYYRTTTLADLGCAGDGSTSWALGPARGANPGAALTALIKLTDPAMKLTPTRAAIGYVDGPPTYLLHRNGRPWASVFVVPDQGDGFNAGIDRLC
jgi:hypothetical protein